MLRASAKHGDGARCSQRLSSPCPEPELLHGGHTETSRESVAEGTVTPACNFVFQVSYLAGSQGASAHPCKCQDTQLAQHLVAICPCERCSSNTLIAVCNHAVPAFGSRFAQYFGEGTNIRENLICRHLVISFGTQSSTVAARLQGLRHGNRKNS